MSQFNNLRKNKSITEKNLNESTLLYSELLGIQSKISDVVEKMGDTSELDSSLTQKLAVVSDYVDSIHSSLSDTGNNEDIVEEKDCDEIVGVLVAVLTEKKNYTFELNDGTEMEITPELAEKISYIHDELSEENQEKLKILLSDSEDSFNVALHFCESYTG